MARSVDDNRLEVLELGETDQPRGELPGAGQRGRRWAVVAVVVLVVVAVIGPVRSGLGVSEFNRLQGQWAGVVVFDQSRFDDSIQLLSYLNGFDDGTIVYPALARTYTSEIADLRAVDSQMGGDLLIDGRLRHIRHLMRAAVAQLIRDLSTAATYYRATVEATKTLPVPGNVYLQQKATLNGLLDADRKRLGGDRNPAPKPVHYPSATAALNHLRRWLDQPVNLEVLASTAGGVKRLDVDRSDDSWLPSSPEAVIVRDGYVAYDRSGTVFAGSSSLNFDPSRDPVIGHIDEVDFLFAADRPDAVWTIAHGLLSEVDGRGHVLAGPVPVPGAIQQRAVAAGIVIVSSSGRLQVFDPSSGRVVCDLGEEAYPVAAGGDLLAWASRNGGLHLTEVSRCDNRSVQLGANAQVLPGGAFTPGAMSPDRHTLVAVITDQAATAVVLVDTRTGQATTVSQLLTDEPFAVRVSWAPDNRRIFFSWVLPGGSATWLTTVQIGNQPSTIRYRGLARPTDIEVLAVTP